MILADILVFFKALAQLFCLRFTIEIFCHFLHLCDGQNSLALSRRLSLFLSIIRKEDDTCLWISTNIFQSRQTLTGYEDIAEKF